MAGGSRDVIMAASRGPRPPAPSEVSPSERRHAATVVDYRGAVPSPAGGHLPVPWRRSPALPSGSPLTSTSAKSNGMPLESGATPRQRDARLPPRPTALGPRPPARQGSRALPLDGSTSATTPKCRVRRPARRASGGTNSRTSCSPAGTTPTLLPPRGATCAGSTSRAWTSATGSHVGCPVGSPRPAPSRGDRARIASAPATRAGRTTSSSVGTRWTARAATARRARCAGTCTAQRVGGTRFAITTIMAAPGRPTGRGPLPTVTT